MSEINEVNAAGRPRVADRRKGTLPKTSPVLSRRGTVHQQGLRGVQALEATSSVSPLPVTIITGFLGSEKTTLLNQILQNDGGGCSWSRSISNHRVDLNHKVAVLVTEFGNINIDSQLLVAYDNDMVELSNGCICCTINEGLVEAVERILAREEKVERLIIETTGAEHGEHHHHHSHHLEADGFVSLSFESDRPFDVYKFNKFLNGELPREVFRAKGIVWFAGSQLRHIFQLCGQRNDIKSEPWSSPPANQLVFIGRHLDTDKLRQQLNDCLATSITV